MSFFLSFLTRVKYTISHNFIKLSLSIVFLSICILFSGCNIPGDTNPQEKVGFYFDTVISITAYEKDFISSSSPFFTRYSDAAENCDKFLDECLSACDRYERLFSTSKEGGDVYNINHANGEIVKINPETYDLLKKALYYAELSDGAFDPTIGSVTSLWNFHADTDKSVPDEASMKEALSHVDYTKLIISKNNEEYSAQLLDKDARLDLGGIAKGYIADKLKEMYTERGLKSGIINLGGNVLLIGKKPYLNNKAIPYVTGIQRPFDKAGETIMTLSLEDNSLVTSGIYDRFFEKDDIIYHHILDSKTGMPIRNNLYSTTIISPSSADGDALSTITYCLGIEKGMELIESIPDTYVMFVTDNYEVVTSNGFPKATNDLTP